MCKLFKVSRSCYYNWIDKGCIVNKIDKELNELVKKIFEQARATYGTRRLKEVLKQRYGLIVSRRKLQRTLKYLNLKVKMKRRFKVITTTFIFSGCVASPSPQIANIDKINSFRDYVIQKRSNEVGNYDVVATTANKTLLELRVFNELTSTANATDVLKVLDDAKSYCKAKSGNIIYGDSAIATIENLPTAFSFDYIGYKNDMQKQGRGKFDGFLKCTNSSDGFEIEYMVDNVDLRRDDMIGGGYMQTYSRFFLINHQKSQSSNQKTWQNNSKYISYEKDKSIKEILSIENNTTPWRYEKAMGAYKYCTFNGGVCLVKNQITKNEPMNIDEYLIQRANDMNKSQIECQEKRKQGQGCYIMSHHTFTDNDTFYCKNQKYTELEFSLEHHNDSIFYKNSLEKF